MSDATELPQPADNLAGTLIAGDELEFYLKTEYAENLARADALLDKGEVFTTIADDDADGDATEFMVKLRECFKTADNARAAEKAPYDANAGLVHAFFKKGILDRLAVLGQKINKAHTDFKIAKANAERRIREEAAKKAREAEAARQAEAERLANEAREAERKAARARNAETIAAAERDAAAKRKEADEAAAANERAAQERAEAERSAAAPMADLSRARGGRGGVSSLKTWLNFRDLDRGKIDLEALRSHLPDKALQQAVNSFIDANNAEVKAAVKNGRQPLVGVTIFEDHKSAGRA